ERPGGACRVLAAAENLPLERGELRRRGEETETAACLLALADDQAGGPAGRLDHIGFAHGLLRWPTMPASMSGQNAGVTGKRRSATTTEAGCAGPETGHGFTPNDTGPRLPSWRFSIGARRKLPFKSAARRTGQADIYSPTS